MAHLSSYQSVLPKARGEQPPEGLLCPAARSPLHKSNSMWRPRGTILAHEGDERRGVIHLAEGIARIVHFTADGHRRVIGFGWPGRRLCVGCHVTRQCAVEAVTPVRYDRYDIASVNKDALCGMVDGLIDDLFGLLDVVTEHNAASRLAWFLLRLPKHLAAFEAEPGVYPFPFPRADIADHIAVRLETVCRLLTAFRRDRLIAFPRRGAIRLPGKADLQSLAQRDHILAGTSAALHEAQ